MRKIIVTGGNCAGLTGWFHGFGLRNTDGVAGSIALVEMDDSAGENKGKVYMFYPNNIKFMVPPAVNKIELDSETFTIPNDVQMNK